MDEYISRERLQQAFWGACKNCLSEDDIADLIDDIPAADVAAVVHSHWKVAIGYDPKKKVQCQHCKLMNYEPEDYCPHCGARMDEKDGEQNE